MFLKIFLACSFFLLLFMNKVVFGDNMKKTIIIVACLFIGGILGNLCDRLFRGFVIDYLDFQLFNIHMPIFNFADMLIVVGVLLLIYRLWKEDKDEVRN